MSNVHKELSRDFVSTCGQGRSATKRIWHTSSKRLKYNLDGALLECFQVAMQFFTFKFIIQTEADNIKAQITCCVPGYTLTKIFLDKSLSTVNIR